MIVAITIAYSSPHSNSSMGMEIEPILALIIAAENASMCGNLKSLSGKQMFFKTNTSAVFYSPFLSEKMTMVASKYILVLC